MTIATMMIATLIAENTPAVHELAKPYQATGASANKPTVAAIRGESESDTIQPRFARLLIKYRANPIKPDRRNSYFNTHAILANI